MLLSGLANKHKIARALSRVLVWNSIVARTQAQSEIASIAPELPKQSFAAAGG